jgi:uncharacterized protein (DUF58 family)
MPQALLHALDLTIARRVEGLLAGDHRSALLGRGTELAQVRPYIPGDDVRLIDWNVTARTGEPHVRVQLAERVLVTWMLLDVSRSMEFGTADRRKADVAEGVSLAIGNLASRRGNRLGVLTFGHTQPRTLPPRAGRAGMMGLLLALRSEQNGRPAGATSLGDALARAAKIAKQRALIAVVSDFRGPLDWQRPLLDLVGRHDVLAIEIRDPREQSLPEVGELWLIDPETRRLLRVDTRDRILRERFASDAERDRADVASMLAGAGARHVVLSTSGDWLRTLASFLGRERRGRFR